VYPRKKEFKKPPHPIIVERVMRRRGGDTRGNGYFGFSMMLLLRT
jgi:hypothetical protein